MTIKNINIRTKITEKNEKNQQINISKEKKTKRLKKYERP